MPAVHLGCGSSGASKALAGYSPGPTVVIAKTHKKVLNKNLSKFQILTKSVRGYTVTAV